MSSTNKTANLNLHSWVRTDPVVCDDFNDNFNIIDEAVGDLQVTRGCGEVYCGTYTGTGAKVFSLTFPKRPVYFITQPNKANNATRHGFVVDGGSFYGHVGANETITISVSGTSVIFSETGTGNSQILNANGYTYHYIAFAPAS